MAGFSIQTGQANGSTEDLGWELHTKDGENSFFRDVIFPSPFASPPQVAVSLQAFRVAPGSVYAAVSVEPFSITSSGFRVKFSKTQAPGESDESRVQFARGNWIAFGMLK